MSVDFRVLYYIGPGLTKTNSVNKNVKNNTLIYHTIWRNSDV